MSSSLEGSSLETWQPSCEEEEDTLPSEERATSQEMKLKEDIKKALKASGVYNNDKLCDAMTVLKTVGVKATQHFELLEAQDLTSRGMTPETTDTLLKEFGRACDEAEPKRENNSFLQYGMAVFTSCFRLEGFYAALGVAGGYFAWLSYNSLK